MTALLYHTDAYAREMEATVIAVADPDGPLGAGLVLDRTVFYPGGGGQPADAGVLRGADGTEYRARATRTQDGGVLHLVEGGLHPRSGARVTGALDWERRYRLMRTHTAMHILCGVIWRDYGAQVTGGNMEPGAGHLDFEFARMQKELVAEIERKINAEVEAARDVRVRILPRAEAESIPDLVRTKVNLLPSGISEIRTVELVGLDLQADGGTHVGNTREVGALRVTGYKSKGAINKRIYVALD